MQDCLFVYGTLMRGFDHPMAKLLSRSAEFLRRGALPGPALSGEALSGLVLSDDADDVVFGELVRLHAPEQSLCNTG